MSMTLQQAKQRAFDEAYGHVMAVGRPSIVEGGCVYSGIGCAASVLLLPNKRLVADEKSFSSIDSLAKLFPELFQAWVKPFLGDETFKVLCKDIQMAHDGPAQFFQRREEPKGRKFRTLFKSRMELVRGNHDLKPYNPYVVPHSHNA